MGALGLDKEEEDKDGECYGDPDSEVDPGEGDELLFHRLEIDTSDGDVVVQVRLLAVHFVGVGDELCDSFLVFLAGVVEDGDVCLVFLAGVLEDADGGFDFGCLTFVLDDAPHGVGDVCQGVFVGLVELGVPAVDPVAEVAGPVLQGGDGDVDSGDVVDNALVVVDDGLDGGVAVVASGGAVALSLGFGGHGVSFLVGAGWVVRIVGMDFSTLFSGGSLLAAFISAFFAAVSWYQALGSKKAKEKAEEAHQAALAMRDAAVRSAKAAEERARQAEKSLKQMEQIVAEEQKQSESQAEIASRLWKPVFELTWNSGDTYLLSNVTGESVEVLEVANLDDFVRCDQIQQVFRPGESLRILMKGASGKPLPSNLELRIRGVDEVIPVPIRR